MVEHRMVEAIEIEDQRKWEENGECCQCRDPVLIVPCR